MVIRPTSWRLGIESICSARCTAAPTATPYFCGSSLALTWISTGTCRSELGRLGVELLGQAQAVDAVDQADERQDRLDLVALEVADHVPAELLGHRPASPSPWTWRRWRNSLICAGPLGQHLHPALAEVGDAELQDLADLLRGGGLGDGDQRHLAPARASPWRRRRRSGP